MQELKEACKVRFISVFLTCSFLEQCADRGTEPRCRVCVAGVRARARAGAAQRAGPCREQRHQVHPKVAIRPSRLPPRHALHRHAAPQQVRLIAALPPLHLFG